MPPLMKRIEREVLEGKQRTKNRKHEHANHGWTILRDFDDLKIVLMNCPCGWWGWMPKEDI